MSLSDWPNVTVVDRDSTTQAVHRVSDCPLCTACVVLINAKDGVFSLRSKEYDAAEQRFLHVKTAVEPGFPSAPVVLSRGSHEGDMLKSSFWSVT